MENIYDIFRIPQPFLKFVFIGILGEMSDEAGKG